MYDAVYLSTRGEVVTCGVYLAGTPCPRARVTIMFDPSPSR
jgi:hypothetical protein